MRDVNALHPDLQLKIAELKQLCEKNGLQIGIGECLRTAAEQNGDKPQRGGQLGMVSAFNANADLLQTKADYSGNQTKQADRFGVYG